MLRLATAGASVAVVVVCRDVVRELCVSRLLSFLLSLASLLVFFLPLSGSKFCPFLSVCVQVFIASGLASGFVEKGHETRSLRRRKSDYVAGLMRP